MARLTGTSGSVEVKEGDCFALLDGSEWEIVYFPGARIYSPSGLGGTPVVACRQTNDARRTFYDIYRKHDHTVDLCGDSIASSIIDARITPAARAALEAEAKQEEG